MLFQKSMMAEIEVAYFCFAVVTITALLGVGTVHYLAWFPVSIEKGNIKVDQHVKNFIVNPFHCVTSSILLRAYLSFKSRIDLYKQDICLVFWLVISL